MSTAAVSSLSILQEIQTFYQSRQSDLKQLGSALQSGDLNGAQQAYNTLATLGQSGPFANAEPFSKSSRVQAFEAIGQALQAGDLAGAQASFATLTGSQSNSAASSPATPAAVVNLTSTPPSNATATSSAPSIYQQLQAYQQQRQADLAQLGQDLQAGDLNAAQQDFNTVTALGQSGPNRNGQPFQRADRTQDFQAIGQALQSGDLAGAQSAYANLAGTFGNQSQQAQSAISSYNSGATEIVINFPGPPTQAPPTEPPVSVGPPPTKPPTNPPVSVGPLVGPPVSNPGPVRPSISTGSAAPGGPELVINLGGASSTSASGGSTTPEIVVNVGQGSGSSSASPEEVTINLGNGSAGTQVTIDETQGKNGSSAEQVTINLNQQKNYELILNLLNSTSTSQTQNSSSNALSVSA